ATAAIGAGPGGSGPAVKTFVDANITITPSATNAVGQPHTFTVTVQQNAGDGNGFVAAPVGNVDVTLSNSNGAVAVLDAAASTFVDANITITPNATNDVKQPHTFTVTVMRDSGDGNGFVVAPVGNVDVTLTNSNGAAFVLNAAASSCDDNQPNGDNLNANG